MYDVLVLDENKDNLIPVLENCSYLQALQAASSQIISLIKEDIIVRTVYKTLKPDEYSINFYLIPKIDGSYASDGKLSMKIIKHVEQD